MKIVLNILKAFLINILFIGIIFASNSCPSISPKDAKDLPVEQAEAILGDILCSFIELHTEGNNTFFSALSLTKKKIIPYIDIEYSTELALGSYWEQLQPMDKKIFERDIKTTLIDEYINSLVNIEDWNQVNITVDKNFSQLNNLAEVKVLISSGYQNVTTTVTLKMTRKDRWRIYDLIFQSFSIVDYFEYSYDEKIKRAGGLQNILQNMLQRT
ncbi:MAG: ABC transporter substrate-binding protein [Candidatus Thioglobus autotrophicus]|nr:ABC transporter substrate-binding protein [Candidatus Thioglobus autotrophicus]